MSLDGASQLNGVGRNGYDEDFDPIADELARESFGQNIEHACR
jgi:hypothetical protein